MEKIIINFSLYTCKNGTNQKIKELLHKGEKAPTIDHEHGTAFNEYNAYLWNIIDTQKGTYIENVYQTT